MEHQSDAAGPFRYDGSVDRPGTEIGELEMETEIVIVSWPGPDGNDVRHKLLRFPSLTDWNRYDPCFVRRDPDRVDGELREEMPDKMLYIILELLVDISMQVSWHGKGKVGGVMEGVQKSYTF